MSDDEDGGYSGRIVVPMVFGLLARRGAGPGHGRVRNRGDCVTMTLLALGPQAQERVISHASTNLHNLSHGHIGTLLGSAFVVDAGPIYGWLPGLVCVLAVAELLWGSWRLSCAFAVGHVGATLLVAVGLTAAVELGLARRGLGDPRDRCRHELRGGRQCSARSLRRCRGAGGPRGSDGGSGSGWWR